jgi:fructose-1,6-bisphosphatase/inositol monophosphatase family enzyme
MATDSDINKYYEVAITLVERAGVVIRAAIDNRDKNVSEKLSPTDLVTETDNAVEKLLVDGLK